jgi:hypothetical protein
MWIQIMARPIPDDWHKRGQKTVARIKAGGGMFGGGSGAALNFAGEFLAALAKPPSAEGAKPPELSERDKTRITAIEEKSRKLI